MAKITGADKVARRFKQMRSPQMKTRVAAALFVAGEMAQVEAQTSITAGSVSGKGHVASLPGQPPNQDTGVLANNIETVEISKERVEVSSNAEYSLPLEVGTSKMEARPFMAPAAAKIAPIANQLIARAIRQQARRSR